MAPEIQLLNLNINFSAITILKKKMNTTHANKGKQSSRIAIKPQA